MNQLKRYEDLLLQKTVFVFGFSLVFCIVVAVFVLTGLLYQDPGAQ